MAQNFDYIPEDIKKEALKDAENNSDKKSSEGSEKEVKPAPKKDKDKAKITGEEKKQRRLFKKKRAGVVLSRDEVKAIKKGRKKLRREMKARGIKSKREFELTAGGLGLYFDKRRGFLFWLAGHWLWALLGGLLALLAVLFIFSIVTQLRGHFTINLSGGMFREGFTLSDNIDFTNPTTALFANPAEDVPAISIASIPDDIDMIDGEHNDIYFAYTYYIRNEGDNNVGYVWKLQLNSESRELSKGCWVLLFEDGNMRFYARPNEITGEAEALPPKDDNTRGYLEMPIMKLAEGSDQFEVIKNVGNINYWRVIPDSFIDDNLIANGRQNMVAPKEVHKYTVVLWLEGDDVDTTDELINGHMGVQMDFRLIREEETEDEDSFGVRWKKFWENLAFWK